MATADGWQPERVLPGNDRNLGKPRLFFADGVGTLLATGQTPDYKSTGIFWFDLRGSGWAGPWFVAEGKRGFWWPSKHSTTLPSFGTLESAGRGMATVFKRAPGAIEEISSSFGLPDIDGSYEFVSIGMDSDGRPYGLANWRGVMILFRLTDSGETEAVLVSDSHAEESGHRSRRAKVMGHPELVIQRGEWHALWAVGEMDASHLHYRRGLIPKSGWMNPRRLTFLLRPSTGLAVSDLDFIEEGVLAEARDAEGQGRMDHALERYAYLVLNQTALSRGGHGAKGDERRVALDRLRELYESGDEETRGYLWALVRNEPAAVFPAENLWRILLAEVDPQVRIESTGAAEGVHRN